MDRREFIQTGAAATLAMSAFAQTPTSRMISSIEPNKLKCDIFSRQLQWLRTADEVADATSEMGYDGVDITVRPYPGHVDPQRVAQDLPPFVNTLRKHGLQVITITCPIADADSPNAEQILRTASSLGINHYWWGSFRYAQDKPLMPQLEALKPRVAKLAALNAKYNMKAMYHTFGGNSTVGTAIWDLLYVLRNFDPAQVGFHYDTGHMIIAGGDGAWMVNLRAAGPYIAGLAVADSVLEASSESSAGGGGSPRGAGGSDAALPNASGASGRGRDVGANKWRSRPVPLGQGMVNLQELAQILGEIDFSGPIEIQAEYPNGGADSGRDKITLPRDQVLGAMKQDLAVLRRDFGLSGLH